MKSDLDQYVPNLTAMRPLCLLAGVHRLWENFHKSGRRVHIPRYGMHTMLQSKDLRLSYYTSITVKKIDMSFEVKCRNKKKITEN